MSSVLLDVREINQMQTVREANQMQTVREADSA